jgi:GNAT superfamily N-acetyltransferase
MVIQYSEKYTQDLKDMANAMHQESVKFCDMSFDANKIVDIATHHYCGLYLIDDNPVGFMLGAKHPTFFGHDIVASELALYLKPENRGGLGAVRLVQGFIKWCKEQGCVEINVGSSVQVATETTKKLYTKLGFIERGFVAYKEL